MINYYSVLGVTNFAPFDDIKPAYRRLSKQWHPDLNGGSAYHAEKFKEIQAAYGCLSKPDARESYDYKLRNHLNGFTESVATQPQYQYNPYSAYYQTQPQHRKRSGRAYPGLVSLVVYIAYLFVKVSTCNSVSSYNNYDPVIPMTYHYNKTAQEILDSIVKANRAANDSVSMYQGVTDSAGH